MDALKPTQRNWHAQRSHICKLMSCNKHARMTGQRSVPSPNNTWPTDLRVRVITKLGVFYDSVTNVNVCITRLQYNLDGLDTLTTPTLGFQWRDPALATVGVGDLTVIVSSQTRTGAPQWHDWYDMQMSDRKLFFSFGARTLCSPQHIMPWATAHIAHN